MTELDVNETNPYRLWAEIHRLRAEAKGPDGYETWHEAAVAERVRRVKLQHTLEGQHLLACRANKDIIGAPGCGCAVVSRQHAKTFVSNRIEIKGDPKNPQPGDHFPVKVGEKWYDTVITEQGVQRFVVNGPVNALVDHQSKMFEEYWMKQRIADHPAMYSLNEMAVDYQMGKWSKEEMIEFYTMFGYSVSGFAGLSFVEDVEIINPLWEE